MFYSTSNNFGAGPIQFKEAREDGYIVLNAQFTVSPQNDAYKAASVLEIYVPDLNIARSTETPVVVQYRYVMNYRGTDYNYHKGTFAKSWIKDANTICIEKLAAFDECPEVTIYIQSLYCQLGQNANAFQGPYKRLSNATSGSSIRFRSTDTFVVTFDKWVFYHMFFDYAPYAQEKLDWEIEFDNMPDDVEAVVPMLSSMYNDDKILGGCMDSYIKGKTWTSKYADRNMGFSNTANDVFSYAFLVRDGVSRSTASGESSNTGTGGDE